MVSMTRSWRLLRSMKLTTLPGKPSKASSKRENVMEVALAETTVQLRY